MIPLLQGTQELFGYIPREAFEKISNDTGIKLSEIYGVATFYAQFRLNPVGKHIVKVCMVLLVMCKTQTVLPKH